jgi:hypothetical protein
MRNFFIMKYILVTLILIGHMFLLIGCKDQPVSIPVITSFKPLTARIDTVDTIFGVNFDKRQSNNLVRINGVTCPIISSRENQIIIRVVPGVSTGKISVATRSLAALSFEDFVVRPHTITSISPYEGKAGDEISIIGSNYPNTKDSVFVLFYDSIPAEILEYNFVSDTIRNIKATVPAGAVNGKISIRIGPLTAVSDSIFKITP